MRSPGRIFRGRKGTVTVITLVVLLAIGVLAFNIVLNSYMYRTSSDNYKNKIQSFYGADGMMTYLAQEMIDTAENQYLQNLVRNEDVGTPPLSGSYGYSPFANCDTVRGAGDIGGHGDHFHFIFRRLKGDVDLSVNVISMTYTDNQAVAGIMIRESLTESSVFAMTLREYEKSRGVRFRYRKQDGNSSVDKKTPYVYESYLRLKRQGNSFTAFRSSNGAVWTVIDSEVISMSDSIYVGLAVASNSSGARCTGIFSGLRGMVRRSYSDSLNLTASGNTWVNYTIDELSPGYFRMTTEGFKKRADGSINHVTKLTQELTRERTSTFLSTAVDSAFLPVTYYDYRSDLSNPEFDVYQMGMKGMVRSTLDSDRKPVPTVCPDPRSCFLNCFSTNVDNWYSMTPGQRKLKVNAVMKWNWACKDNCISTWFPGYPDHSTCGWWFSDSLRLWFRPSDAPGAVFDCYTGMWSYLNNRPDGSGGIITDEWVGKNYDSTSQYATIVMYDSLKFREIPSGSGIFVFGDPTYSTTVDTQYFVQKECATKWSLNDYKFMPLKNRGFGYDPWRYTPASTCPKIENFAFTMEMHRQFTYKKGQMFAFTGDDDVWVFINNRLVIDLGGIHLASSDTVDLDTLELVAGEEYWFDFFFCERMIAESNMMVTTNMLMFLPPLSTKRSWRRDYGNLD